MTQEAQCNLVVVCARLLYVNGQGTEQILAAIQDLMRALGLRASLSLRWGELQLQLDDGKGLTWRIAANPAGVDMNRVTAAMRVIDNVKAGRFTLEDAQKAIDVISRSTGTPTWIFALAAGAGATAMAVIFGVQHVVDASVIFISAFLGALLRRALARLGTNALVQPFCASLLAGLIAGAAFRWQLVTSLRIVALCPCVILIPGAHVLNGLADLITGRLPLGAARLIHAGLITAAITTALLFGLVLCGASLPLTEAVRAVPLWQHIIAAGVAVAAFGVFFSMPVKQLPWAVMVGALAQALRWAALTVGLGVGAASFIASLAVGVILIPVARRQRIPFAAVGFVSIVSMIPGAYLFTMASGLMQIARGQDTSLEPISLAIANGTNAALIILAISLGLVIPKLVLDFLEERRSRNR